MCFDFNDSSVWDIEIESVNPTDSYDVVLAIIVPFYSYFFFFFGCCANLYTRVWIMPID